MDFCWWLPKNNFTSWSLDDFLETIGSSYNCIGGWWWNTDTFVRKKQVVGLTIKMKKNKKSLPRIQWKKSPLMGYYNKQGKFYAVNGIGTIQEITERLSTVIDKL
jgi:adenylate kinase